MGVLGASLHLFNHLETVTRLALERKGRLRCTEALEAGNVVQVVEGAAADNLVVEVQVESAATVMNERTKKSFQIH